jgi:predicted lipoprotein with Yx(FWY)xxD motif
VRDGVLTAPNGMTLYTFDRDPVGAGKSACNGPCAASWPPLAASSAESGGTGGGYGSYGGYGGSGAGSGGDYSVITRDDGSKQVAYKGRPLYFWINDKKPGDRTGDGFNGVWHAARP